MIDEDLYSDICLWAESTFVGQPLSGKIEHLKQEVNELGVECEDNPHSYKAKEELADVFILLANIAFRMSLTVEDVQSEIAKKLETNKQRTWGKLDEKGVSHHI